MTWMIVEWPWNWLSKKEEEDKGFNNRVFVYLKIFNYPLFKDYVLCNNASNAAIFMATSADFVTKGTLNGAYGARNSTTLVSARISRWQFR